ncbi:acyltransferase family protein [Curtobacterium flaccumfaciens]|uniref:acyltransferase family protein n=1 Tax=Curtobacterium flaccumfaciens TaxID=2035 RepID=UPI003F823B8D
MVKRRAGIDAVRILGIIGVVAGHVWWQSELVRAIIYTWHVPVFFFLTGFFWHRDRSIATEISVRARTLLVPYLTWLVAISAVYLPWLYITGRESTPRFVVDLLLGGSHIGRPYSAFWFITALFVATVTLRLVQRLPLWIPASIAGAATLVTFVTAQPIAAIPLSAGTAVPAITFLLCGYAARRVHERVAHPRWVAAALLGASAVVIAAGANSVDLKQADFGTPVASVLTAVAISWALVLLATSFENRIPPVVARWITDLAGSGTGVILAHAAVLQTLSTPEGGRSIDFILALVLPWVAMTWIRRTSLSPLFLGIPRRAREAVPRSGSRRRMTG